MLNRPGSEQTALELVREIEVNVAYRWFLRLKLTDGVFDASTLSQNQRWRYNDTKVAQEIFDRIVEQAMARGFVDGHVLYTDSTHLKANANKTKYDLAMASKSRAAYWDALDGAIDEDRAAHGKRPVKPAPRAPAVKETKISRTDPEAGYMVREGKPKGFFYLDHRTVDGKLGIITGTYATPFNVHDSIPYLERLDRQRERFGLDVKSVGLDAVYANAAIAPMRGGWPTGARRSTNGENRFLKEHITQSKPFTWTADPDKIIAAVRRGRQMLDSIH